MLKYVFLSFFTIPIIIKIIQNTESHDNMSLIKMYVLKFWDPYFNL